MSIADTLVIWNFKKPEINCSTYLPGEGKSVLFSVMGGFAN